MITRGFIDLVPNESDRWWSHNSIDDLKDQLKPLSDNLVDEKVSCASAIDMMKAKSVDCLLYFKDG